MSLQDNVKTLEDIKIQIQHFIVVRDNTSTTSICIMQFFIYNFTYGNKFSTFDINKKMSDISQTLSW